MHNVRKETGLIASGFTEFKWCRKCLNGNFDAACFNHILQLFNQLASFNGHFFYTYVNVRKITRPPHYWINSEIKV